MGKLSKRHHYIPQYYLRGFTNSDKKFYLYEVQKDKIDKNPHSTNSVFFEKNRNTIRYKGMVSDVIEQEYARLDTTFSHLFKEIENGVAEDELFAPNILIAIKQFFALFLCRLPIIDRDIGFILDKLDFSKTRNIITVNGVNSLSQEKTKKMLAEDKDFRYFFRCFILPILIFDYMSKDNGRWYLFQMKDARQKHLCCDIPILIKNDDLLKLLSFDTDFIFPISKSKLLVHSMKKDICKEKISPLFYVKVDLLLFWKAQKYVVCPDEEYLKDIQGLKKKVEKEYSFDEFSACVFDMLNTD